MSDPKRAKALRTIASLQKVVDHPNTGEGERAAAQGRIDALREKHDIKRHETFNSTSKEGPWATRPNEDLNDWLKRNFGGREQPNDTAARIQEQQRQYEEWKRKEEANRKRMADQRAREAMDAEAKRKREYEAWEKANEAMLKRQQAQRNWEKRNQSRDARGVPLTDAERRAAQADPLGWASRQDGRTQEQKNRDMQTQYTHGWNRPPGAEATRCSSPLTFYDQGGEPRRRNTVMETCRECGSLLGVGEGAKVTGGWQCAETTPGPRRKKPGRG